MRRWIARTCARLALGAITSVGVTWACVATGLIFFHRPSVTDAKGADGWCETPLHSARGYGYRVYFDFDGELNQPAPSCGVPDVPTVSWLARVQMRHKRVELFTAFEAGWPFRCFTGLEAHVRGDGDLVERVGLIPIRSFARTGCAVLAPIIPTWGLAANSILFAAPWALVLAAPTVIRRSLTPRRRDRCPVCLYDLLGDFSSGCPECGWARRASALMDARAGAKHHD